MTLQQRIQTAVKEAMKAKDADRLSTLRLINAAFKDREIAARTGNSDDSALTEADLVAILSRMVKQRQESAKAYEEGGRIELADKERAEITVVQEFLPRQLGADETRKAIETVIAELGATSIREMGPVMAALKARYAGQMDFGAAGPIVKEKLL